MVRGLKLLCWMFCLLFAFVMFVGCQKDTSTNVATKTYPWWDTTFTLVDDTTSTTTICAPRIVEMLPEDGAEDIYYRGSFAFRFSTIPETITVAMYEDGGTYIEGLPQFEDDWLIWEPLVPLLPETAYEMVISWECDHATASWITSDVGYPVEVDLTGMTYGIDIGDGVWIEPAGVSALLSTLLVTTNLVVEVVNVDEEYETLDLRFATWYNAEQNECAPTVDFVDVPWDENPYCALDVQKIAISPDGFDLTIWDFWLAGSFAADGSRIQGLELSGLVDTRYMADAFGLPNNGFDATCQLVASFGVNCTFCPDGFEFCLQAEVVGLNAPRVQADIAVISEEDVSDNDDCN